MRDKSLNEVILITDGGCRANPGKGAIAFIIADENKNVLYEVSKFIGNATNNQAEYKALIGGLHCSAKFTKGTVKCYLDSELVVKQAKNEYRVKDNKLKKLFILLQEKERFFREVVYIHKKRTHPAIQYVDRMVNKNLDKRGF